MMSPRNDRKMTTARIAAFQWDKRSLIGRVLSEANFRLAFTNEPQADWRLRSARVKYGPFSGVF